MNFTNNYEILQNKVIVNAKKPQTFTGVLVERSYNNGFQLLYTLPPSRSTVWESLSTGKTLLTPSRLVDSLFPGVAELSEIS
jgi:hypothetical protein